MTFWDKVGKAIGNAADSLEKEVRTAGKQYELGQLEGDIERQYVEMGKRAHELYRQRELLDAEIEVIARRIARLEEQMDELRREALQADTQAAQQTGGSPSQPAAPPQPVQTAPPPQPVQSPPPPQPADGDDDGGMPTIGER